MADYTIAYLPGDGIGHEVLPEGRRVVEAVMAVIGRSVRWVEHDWGCERHAKTGRMMPEDGIEQLRDHDAIYLGAVGWPGVPDHVSLWGMLIPMRRAFDLYANVRPVRLMPGVVSPLRDPGPIDFVVVRENVEGEYSPVGGRVGEGTDRELVVQQSIFTRRGCDRIMDYAFDVASRRKAEGGRGRVTSATKSNGIVHAMPFWDERFAAASKRHPEIGTDQYHIDILTALFVTDPARFDVVVGSNLFGDILSDLGPAVASSIGIAPSANLDPTRRNPSLFEPVHGSAPDIAGRGIANPVGAIWAAALMLDHLGEHEASRLVTTAMDHALASERGRTQDIGGNADTRACASEIVLELRRSDGR